MTDEEYGIRKDMEENGSDPMKLLSRNLPGGSEEKHENLNQDS
jgi:hypothetical protein